MRKILFVTLTKVNHIATNLVQLRLGGKLWRRGSHFAKHLFWGDVTSDSNPEAAWLVIEFDSVDFGDEASLAFACSNVAGGDEDIENISGGRWW